MRDAAALPARDELAQALEIEATATAKPISALGSPEPSLRTTLPREDAEIQRLLTKVHDKKQNIRLKTILAWFAVGAVGVQLLAANGLMYVYTFRGPGYPSDTVMVAWMSSTVVETIGIVYVIARNLFPDKSKRAGDSTATGSKASGN